MKVWKKTWEEQRDRMNGNNNEKATHSSADVWEQRRRMNDKTSMRYADQKQAWEWIVINKVDI